MRLSKNEGRGLPGEAWFRCPDHASTRFSLVSPWGGRVSFLFRAPLTIGQTSRKVIGQKIAQSNFIPPLATPISINEAHRVEPRLMGKTDNLKGASALLGMVGALTWKGTSFSLRPRTCTLNWVLLPPFTDSMDRSLSKLQELVDREA